MDSNNQQLQEEPQHLVKYDEFVYGMVLHRPSKVVKSPYMADVLTNSENVLCHSPSGM